MSIRPSSNNAWDKPLIMSQPGGSSVFAGDAFVIPPTENPGVIQYALFDRPDPERRYRELKESHDNLQSSMLHIQRGNTWQFQQLNEKIAELQTQVAAGLRHIQQQNINLAELKLNQAKVCYPGMLNTLYQVCCFACGFAPNVSKFWHGDDVFTTTPHVLQGLKRLCYVIYPGIGPSEVLDLKTKVVGRWLNDFHNKRNLLIHPRDVQTLAQECREYARVLQMVKDEGYELTENFDFMYRVFSAVDDVISNDEGNLKAGNLKKFYADRGLDYDANKDMSWNVMLQRFAFLRDPNFHYKPISFRAIQETGPLTVPESPLDPVRTVWHALAQSPR